MMGDTNANVSLEKIYPVGSIYMNLSNNSNPSEIFGFGTWQALDEGRVLLGANATYSAGSKGGESVHTLTTGEIPSHGHSASASNTNLSHKHAVWTGGAGAFSGYAGRFVVEYGGGSGWDPESGGVMWCSETTGRAVASDGSSNKATRVNISVGDHAHGADMDYQLGDHSHDITVNNSGGGGGTQQYATLSLGLYVGSHGISAGGCHYDW